MIDKILLTLDEKFEDVYFDIEEVTLGDGTKKYCVFVSDYEFYMSKIYKKWRKILNAKYPGVPWFSVYLKKRFE